jgi:hypothetical protein
VSYLRIYAKTGWRVPFRRCRHPDNGGAAFTNEAPLSFQAITCRHVSLRQHSGWRALSRLAPPLGRVLAVWLDGVVEWR